MLKLWYRCYPWHYARLQRKNFLPLRRISTLYLDLTFKSLEVLLSNACINTWRCSVEMKRQLIGSCSPKKKFVAFRLTVYESCSGNWKSLSCSKLQDGEKDRKYLSISFQYGQMICSLFFVSHRKTSLTILMFPVRPTGSLIGSSRNRIYY